MTLDEYQAHCDRLVADFKANSDKYLIPDDVTQHLLPGIAEFEEASRNVLREAAAHLRKNGGFSMKELMTALRRRQREIEKQEKERDAAEQMASYHERVEAGFGGTPTNAREAVLMFVNRNNISLRYDLTCYMHGHETKGSSIENAILLTAEGLGLTLGDRRVMSMQGIKLAWAEFVEQARSERLNIVWEQIARTDPATAAKALAQLRDLCEKLFVEPQFADAAIRKWIWQIKRRMQRLPVRDHHFLVFRGQQKTGKTELCREILRPIQEIAVETTLSQILDDRNHLIRSMFVGFPDELARAERADLNSMKTVVTGESSTSRVLFSHTAEKNRVNLSLIGTADKPIVEMMSDAAGMRRFVECVTKPKHQLNLNWEEEVVALPWLGIWRAVDYECADPLMSVFGEDLKAKQDAMRQRTNVEAWVEAFVFDSKIIATPRKRDFHPEDLYADYGAEDLYRQSFRTYEDTFHPGSKGTSMTSWGRKFKELIDDGRLPQWSYHRERSAVLYRYHLDAAQPDKDDDSAVVPLHSTNRRARQTAYPPNFVD